MIFTDELHQILIDYKEGKQPGESINAIKESVRKAFRAGEIKTIEGETIVFRAEDLELR